MMENRKDEQKAWGVGGGGGGVEEGRVGERLVGSKQGNEVLYSAQHW